MFRMLGLCVLALLPQMAAAASVDVQVRDSAGQPVVDAVVTVEPAQPATTALKFPWPYVVSQKDISFQPHVLIVPVGASVSFPNLDKVRHHVYSFSKVKKFQLKLYGQDESRAVVFDAPGVVSLGCNIHDSMSGFIVVVSTPFAAKTDATGRVRLTNVPAGGATLRLWSPQIRTPGNQIVSGVSIPPSGFTKTIAIGG
jgi:plastocyanin